MEKRPKNAPAAVGGREKDTQRESSKRQRKVTAYGRQLQEKQKVKWAYGMRERQFVRFFALATLSKEATGEKLLSLLERRLDNVVYRLKLATTRPQARQVVVHGHIFVNGKKVHSPSYLVEISDEVSLAPLSNAKTGLLTEVVDKRLATNIKVPDWLESDKTERKGRVIRYPARADIQLQVNENIIVELYSK
jgi:small subunit ribosomal protein S4